MLCLDAAEKLKLPLMAIAGSFDERWIPPLVEFLKAHARTRTGRRGGAYAKNGNVRSIDLEDDECIESQVRGGEIYDTSLFLDYKGMVESGEVWGECTCPVGIDCKHVVAVAYVLAAFAKLGGSAHSGQLTEVLEDGAVPEHDMGRQVDVGSRLAPLIFSGEKPRGKNGHAGESPQSRKYDEWWLDFIKLYGAEEAKAIAIRAAESWLPGFRRRGHYEIQNILSFHQLPDNPFDYLRRFEGLLAKVPTWRNNGDGFIPDKRLAAFLTSPQGAAAEQAWRLGKMQRNLSEWVNIPAPRRKGGIEVKVKWSIVDPRDSAGLRLLFYRFFYGRDGNLKARTISGIQSFARETNWTPDSAFSQEAEMVQWVLSRPELKYNPYMYSGEDNTILPITNALAWLGRWKESGLLRWENDAQVKFDPLPAKLGLLPAGPGECQWGAVHPLFEKGLSLTEAKLAADHSFLNSYASDKTGRLYIEHGDTLVLLETLGVPSRSVINFRQAGVFPMRLLQDSPLAVPLVKRLLNHGSQLLFDGAVEDVLVQPLIEFYLDGENRMAVSARATGVGAAFILDWNGEWSVSAPGVAAQDKYLLMAGSGDTPLTAPAEAGKNPPLPNSGGIIRIPRKADVEAAEKWLERLFPPNAKNVEFNGKPAKEWKLRPNIIPEFMRLWDERPKNTEFFGTKEFVDLVTVRPAPRISIKAETSGINWLSLSVELENELGRVTPGDLEGYLSATRDELVRLPGGTYRRKDLEEYRTSLDAVMNAGILPNAGPQRVHALQLGGAAGKTLLEMAGRQPAMADIVQRARKTVEGFKGVPKTSIGKDAEKLLRPYQRQGVDFLVWAAETFGGAVLADEMGLGKTLQILLAVSALRKRKGNSKLPSLIICPASVQHNWRREAERFVPHLKVGVLERGEERRGLLKRAGEFDVLVKNYALTRRDQETLRARQWLVVGVDEAQAIKNPGAEISLAVKSLDAKYRFALTGTPIENRLGDLVSIAEFAVPGYLSLRPDKALNAGFLRGRMRPVMVRRLKAEVATELPPRIEERLDCRMISGQKKVYLHEAARARETLKAFKGDKAVGKDKIIMLAALTRLRQICCDPALLGLGDTGSGKVDEFLDLVRPLVESGKKVLVFSQFVRMLNRLETSLGTCGIKTYMLTGKTTRRQELVEGFERDASPSVFLISLKAGGMGLNLVSASHVVLFDPWWNPAVEAQAIDRAHRIGQDKTVVAFRLVTAGTIEERILELQEKKLGLIRDVLEEDAFNRALSKADFEFLLAE